MDLSLYLDLPLPVIVLDDQGTALFANRAANRLASELDLACLALLPTEAFQPTSHDALEWRRDTRVLRWRPQPLATGQRLWIAEDLSAEHAAIASLTNDKRHYRELAESTTDLISRHAKDGTFLYASKAAKSLLGYEPEELIGASAYDMFHPEDLSALLNKSSRIYHDSGFYQQTYRFRAKDGHYVWFETTSRTHRDSSTGELVDILCVSRDVSRRIHAEATRERLARVVESTTDYVLFIDDDERLFYSNEAARRLLGLSSQDSETRLRQVYDEESLNVLRRIALPATSRYGSWSGELEMLGLHGPVPVLTVLLSHRNPAASPGHLSLLNRDISLRKRSEAQARSHQQQIAHANRLAATGELASNIAHELNQPLGAIANYANGLLMQLRAAPNLPAAALETPIVRLNDQVQRLAERLRHIRNFVRKGQIRPRPTTLSAILESACHLCAWQFKAERIDIELDLGDALPAVLADATALEQVVVNLLLNALEASRDMPGAHRVTLSSWQASPREVAFAVTDQGPGLSAEQAVEVFAPFYSTKPEGLGMGLAISRSLMEAMSGELSLDTGTSGGARFIGTLRAEAPTGRVGH